MKEFSAQVTILGCGHSAGVPLIHCQCPVCCSKHPRNKRLRSSIWIQTRGKSLLIDTSTDLRQQAIRAKIPRIDAVLYTHPHADHTHGIDELRSFNFIQKSTIPLYGNAWTCQDLKTKFSYIFQPGRIEGGGIPLLEIHPFESSAEKIDVLGVPVIPIGLPHGSKECIAYRIDNFAYVTDCHEVPEAALKKLEGVKTLVLDCLRITPHPTHLNLEQALEIVAHLRPQKTYLTHLGHEMDYLKWKKKLPKGVAFAYDGLVIHS